MFYPSLFSFILLTQLIFVVADDEKTKWPEKNSGDVDITKDDFTTFISLYLNSATKNNELYRMDSTNTVKINSLGTSEEGWKMKLWQSSFGNKDYVVDVEKDFFYIIDTEKSNSRVMIKEGDGFKKIENESKAFVLDKYLIADKENVYDLEKAVSDKKVTPLTLEDVTLSNGDKLNDVAKSLISDTCFSDTKDIYCAPYLTGTVNFKREQISAFQTNKVVMFFDDLHFMYVKCGTEAKLNENKRCYYYMRDEVNGTDCFIPKDVEVNNNPPSNGIRTMLFPFINQNDPFVQQFLSLTTPKPTIDPNSTIESTTTGPNATIESTTASNIPKTTTIDPSCVYEYDYDFAVNNSKCLFTWLFLLLIVLFS